ncbi:MAG: hypothetical protein HDT46_06005 [Ruminococcaceae bacterium]|nr:hypothetical protein [Oscillospiraceae bacterium]
MKKHNKFTALLCAALLLCSCGSPENITETSATDATAISDTEMTASTADTEITTAETTAVSESSNETDIADLPRMDGSTSATPLEIGLKSGFLGISYKEAKELVSHTTTHDSFKRLINGEVDLIFSVPISEEQQKMADEAGVTLFMEPVAREGFVFVVNEENPVDSLTSEQLRKIYSGEITNWSEVGGNDEPILPYQRNTDSGSQNYMTVFMGDTPLLPPRTELVQGMMMSLMDAIAVYDNSAGAIGYSVYSYAAQMYANANKVKFISVDGVAPSKATMADESYPLLSCTYIIYTDKSPESAREFTEKVISDEGQSYVLESGYLPVNGMEVPEKYLPYEAKGTGEQKPVDFTPSREYSALYLWDEGYRCVDGYYELTFLNDEELQSRINADIRTAMDDLKQLYDPKYKDEDTIKGIKLDITCRNGYLSLVLGYFDHDVDYDPMYGEIDAYYHAETLNYDLFAGKKIERFSDLFYEGEDFMPEVNQSIENWINQELLAYSDPGQKLDFSGILGEPRLFTINGIILEPDNLYFACAPLLCYSDANRQSIVTQYRDMTELITEKNIRRLYEYPYAEWETAYVIEDGDTYQRITGSAYHTDEEVKAEDEFWYELQHRAWDSFRTSDPDWHSTYTGISLDTNENYYSVRLCSVAAGERPRANFDADTLELMTMEMLVGENWREYLNGEENDDLNLIPSEWWSDDGSTVNIYAYSVRQDEDSSEYFGYRLDMKFLHVPINAMNGRYFTE